MFTQSKDSETFFMNNRLFDADRVDTRVNLGDIEDWTIRNDTDDMHVSHIHQLPFQVLAVNNAAVPFAGLVDTERAAGDDRSTWWAPLPRNKQEFTADKHGSERIRPDDRSAAAASASSPRTLWHDRFALPPANPRMAGLVGFHDLPLDTKRRQRSGHPALSFPVRVYPR